MLKTPIAFIIFNRPDTTAQVFESIRKAKPSKLLVIADGARQHKIGEVEKCVETRKIIEGVDWECEVITNYSDVNLGCKLRVSSGIDWVFEQVEEAIILEDDCVPEHTFFAYCDELLERYRYDTRIVAISGTNLQSGQRRTSDSYYFSRYMHVWGWATWRRSWQNYDVDMKQWPTVRDGGWLQDILNDKLAIKGWQKSFQRVYDGKIDTWDFQWVFACWIQSGLVISPNINLISNIGFGPGATHTFNKSDLCSNIPTSDMPLPLQHPKFMLRNSQADDYTQKKFFNPKLIINIKSFVYEKISGNNQRQISG
jgi:hypothetical protein